MVVTFEPWACAASMVQDFTLLPSTCTTQAPHWLVSQPTCVPVMLRCSRRNCTRRVRGSTSRVTGWPLTVIVTEMVMLSSHGARRSVGAYRALHPVTLGATRKGRQVAKPG